MKLVGEAVSENAYQMQNEITLLGILPIGILTLKDKFEVRIR